MKQLTHLTPEQEAKMSEVKQYWLDYIFSCKNSLDKAKAKVQIEWLYKFCGLDAPIVIFLDSPMACQYGGHLVKELVKILPLGKQVGSQVWSQVWSQVRSQVWSQIESQVGSQIESQVWSQIESQIESQVWSQVGSQVWSQVWSQVRSQVWSQIESQVGSQIGLQVKSQIESQVGLQVKSQVASQIESQVASQVASQIESQVKSQIESQIESQVWSQVEFETFGSYSNIYSYGWVSFYDFFTQIGVLSHKEFNEFKSLIQCGIYDTIQLKGFCIVSGLPSKINRNGQNQLHCEDGPAIQFRDGYSQYYWNGVSVPQFWIENKSEITKDVILKEDNAERRRCLREILGPSKYFELLGGVKELDRDTDDQGNEMVLYRSKVKDDIINKHIQYLSVICPSTQRQYILYPPNQESKNVWEAKASTFRNEKIQIRHGDVGLLNLKKEFSKPLFES